MENLKVLITDDIPESPRYVVIAARYLGRWVFVRHKERETYEIPGGRVEPGETPAQAARRELYEETGAAEYDLKEVCGYGVDHGSEVSWGALYLARVERFDDMPEYEIAERILCDGLPEHLTYPHIQPLLFEQAENALGEQN